MFNQLFKYLLQSVDCNFFLLNDCFRGGSTWKPSVTPVGPSPSIGNVQPVTKTSLAYKQPSAPQPNAYNLAPRPFGGSQVNGETIKSITSKQYNTPVALYSEETIAETLSAQAEVLAGGVLGLVQRINYF